MPELKAGSDGKEDRSDGVVFNPILGTVKAQGRSGGIREVQERRPAGAYGDPSAGDEDREGEAKDQKDRAEVLGVRFAARQVLSQPAGQARRRPSAPLRAALRPGCAT